MRLALRLSNMATCQIYPADNHQVVNRKANILMVNIKIQIMNVFNVPISAIHKFTMRLD